MTWVATQNFGSVDQMLEMPRHSMFTGAVEKLGGHDGARLFMRYQAAEMNRFLFEHWELVQLALGAVLFLLILLGTHEGKAPLAIVLLMIALVGIVHLFVTPPIIGIGRELDFQPPAARPALREQFQTWHVTYSTLEVLKLLLGAGLGYLLVRSHSRRPGRGDIAADHKQ